MGSTDSVMAAPGAAGFIGGRILGGIGTYAQITAVSWYVFHITGDPVRWEF